MRIDLSSVTQTIIVIGNEGENVAKTVEFDYSSYAEEFGEGTAYLWYIRPNDGYEYPIRMEAENDIATWNVSALDTRYEGDGQVQLIYVVNNVVKKKSKVFTVKVMNSIDPAEETPPDPYQSWFDEIIEASESAMESATTATSAKEDAESARDEAVSARDVTVSAKDEAVTASQTAITKASEASASASNAQTSETNAVNAKNTAVSNATIAQTSASSAMTSAENASVSAQNAQRYATELEDAIYRFTDSEFDGNITVIKGGI